MSPPTQTLQLNDTLQQIECQGARPGKLPVEAELFGRPMAEVLRSGSLTRLPLPGVGLGVIYNLSFRENTEYVVASDCDLLDIALRKRGGFRASTESRPVHYLEGAELEVHALRAGVANLTGMSADSEIQMVVIHMRPQVLQQQLGIDPRQLPRTLGNFVQGLSREEHVELRYTLPDRVARALDGIMETEIGPALRPAYFQAKLMECLLDVLDLLQKPEQLARRDGFVGKNLRPFDRARSVLLQEFRNPPSLDELARRVGVSRRKLTDGFRRQYSMSPMAFAQKLRMEEARRLLQTGEFQIAQVAHRIGYQQAANFSQAYKAHFGHSPKHDL